MFAIMPDKPTKKYPITFRGKEYEVRWHFNWLEDEILKVYEVIHKQNPITKKKYKKYRFVYRRSSLYLGDYYVQLELDPNRDDKFIILIFLLMESMYDEQKDRIEAENTRQKQLAAFNNWDGNLDTRYRRDIKKTN